MDTYIKVNVKVMKNGLGQYGVWWGVTEKCPHLGYRRFFKTKETAQRWADKLKKQLNEK